MATTAKDVPKKKSIILLRDVIKLCRSIARLWPRDKPNEHSSCSPFDFDVKTNLKAKSKRSDYRRNLKVFDVHDLPSTNQEGEEGDAKEGVSLCRLRSYRYDGAGDKKPSGSRSCSGNPATPMMRRNLSLFNRSRSSSPGTDAAAFGVQRSVANPILYSSSTATVAKPPPTEEELSCTLEELCNGCTKKIMIKRDVITSSGEMRQEEEMVEIKVKPGWRGGTKVTFEGKGNEAMGSVAADLTFVIAEREHELFTRKGDDLEMEVEIPLVEALTGCEFSIALPDGDNMKIMVDDVIHHEYITLIQGKGMPRLREKGKRGDLKIKFRTKFPEKLTGDQRAEIWSILESSA